MPKMSLNIAPGNFAFLKELSKHNGFAGPNDCLHGIVNSVLLEWRDKIDGHSVQDENRKRLESIINEQAIRISVLSSLLLDAIESKAKQALEFEAKLKERPAVVMRPLVAPRSKTKPATGSPYPGDLDDDIPF